MKEVIEGAGHVISEGIVVQREETTSGKAQGRRMP